MGRARCQLPTRNETATYYGHNRFQSALLFTETLLCTAIEMDDSISEKGVVDSCNVIMRKNSVMVIVISNTFSKDLTGLAGA